MTSISTLLNTQLDKQNSTTKATRLQSSGEQIKGVQNKQVLPFLPCTCYMACWIQNLGVINFIRLKIYNPNNIYHAQCPIYLSSSIYGHKTEETIEEKRQEKLPLFRTLFFLSLLLSCLIHDVLILGTTACLKVSLFST